MEKRALRALAEQAVDVCGDCAGMFSLESQSEQYNRNMRARSKRAELEAEE